LTAMIAAAKPICDPVFSLEITVISLSRKQETVKAPMIIRSRETTRMASPGGTYETIASAT
jgi:hypothetical protein